MAKIGNTEKQRIFKGPWLRFYTSGLNKKEKTREKKRKNNKQKERKKRIKKE